MIFLKIFYVWSYPLIPHYMLLHCSFTFGAKSVLTILEFGDLISEMKIGETLSCYGMGIHYSFMIFFLFVLYIING